MEPTLKDGQIVLIRKESTNMHENDIIVFTTEDYGVCIKRVLAVANETVKLSDGIIFVNGIQVTPYTCDQHVDKEYTLSKGEYFVIGDNFNDSIDSRVFGIVHNENILGKVIAK